MRRVVDIREGGFTIVEVLIAMLMLVIAGASAMAMASTATNAQSKAKLRQVQAAIAEQSLATVKTTVTWPKWTSCTTNPTCDLSSLFPSSITDARTGMSFKITARAAKQDAMTDLQGANDTDGLTPDYFRIQVSVKPIGATAATYPKVDPVVLTGQMNQSNRQDQGKLIIQACWVTPQIDERIPVASCPNNNTQPVEIVPPLGMSWGAGGGSGDCSNSADGKDCASYICAHPWWDTDCFGNSYTIPIGNSNFSFVGLDIRPSSGWSFHVYGDPSDTNTSGFSKWGTLGSAPSSKGVATLTGMTPGQYRVRIYPDAARSSWTEWLTHSEPARGYATVEPGATSRSITMFRPPKRTSSVRIDIQTVDSTDPYNPVTHPQVWPAGRSVSYRLVPSPIGRTTYGALRTATSGQNHFNFPNTEPGLYAGYLTYDGRFLTSLSHHPGFIWVPYQSGLDTIPPSNQGYGNRAMLTLGYCDPAGRNALNAGGFFSTGPRAQSGVDANGNPVYNGPLTAVWYSCGSGVGPSPTGSGTGGGGGA